MILSKHWFNTIARIIKNNDKYSALINKSTDTASKEPFRYINPYQAKNLITRRQYLADNQEYDDYQDNEYDFHHKTLHIKPFTLGPAKDLEVKAQKLHPYVPLKIEKPRISILRNFKQISKLIRNNYNDMEQEKKLMHIGIEKLNVRFL